MPPKSTQSKASPTTTKPAAKAAGTSAPKARPKAPKFEKFPKDMLLQTTTPRGTAIWPTLPPQEPETKFDKDGVYKVRISVPLADAQPLMDECAELLAEANAHFLEETGQSAKPCDSLPYQEEVDEDGNATGNVVFGFKAKAKGLTKTGKEYTRTPAVVDSKKKPVRAVVGGGSILRVRATYRPFYTSLLGLGLSAQLEMVQVIELHQYNGQDPNAAFEEEDGYVSDESDDGSGPVPTGDDAGTEASEL